MDFTRFQPTSSSSFAEDFSNYIKQMPYDFCIVIKNSDDDSDEETSIDVHRFILQMRSDVFKAMLSNSESVECKTGKLIVKDFPYKVMDTLIEAMYDPYYSLADLHDFKCINTLCMLFSAADKYNFPLMISVCAQRLIEMLNPETAPMILSTSDLHKCGNLFDVTLDFIKQNKDAVKSTDEWKEMIEGCNVGLLRLLADLD